MALRHPGRQLNRRWEILAIVAFILFVLSLLPILAGGFTEDSIRWGIRRTADIAFPLLFLSFGASSLHYFTRSSVSAWLMHNRRYLGISFGMSFLLHGGLIILRGAMYPDPFLAELGAETFVPGGLAFTITIFMTATSNDYSVRLLGRRGWSAGHAVGGYILALLFLGTYSSSLGDPFFWPYFGLAALLPVMRLVRASLRRYRRTEPIPD